MEHLHKKNGLSDDVKIGAVISEFNPFHNGHKYCLKSLRKKGATHIICIMSGCFVQRGDPAYINPFDRAVCAVENGADLVIELPAVYALSSAERFADGAVCILNKMGCVDYLGFGVETANSKDDISEEIINKLLYVKRLKSDNIISYTEQGYSYPKAFHTVACECFGDNFSDYLKSGNNVLAMSYMDSLEKYNSDIKPIFINRKSTLHDSMVTPDDDIASASYIRSYLADGNLEEVKKYLPKQTISMIEKNKGNGSICDIKKLESAILYKLRNSSLQDFENIIDIGNQGLANRFFSAKDSVSLYDFMGKVKTKRYPLARIKRHLLSYAINITADDLNLNPCVARILAFNKKGTEIIKKAKSGNIFLSTSLAEISELNDDSKRFAQIEKSAYDLYTLGYDKIGSGTIAYTKKIKITK